MVGSSDLEIGAGVRRELSGRRVDLSRLKCRVEHGVIALSGELSFIGFKKTSDEIAIEIKLLENRLKMINGVASVTMTFDNWELGVAGKWEPKATISPYGETDNLPIDGMHCPTCNVTFKFCPCCGKPLVKGEPAPAYSSVKPALKVVPVTRGPIISGASKTEPARAIPVLTGKIPIQPPKVFVPPVPIRPVQPPVTKPATEPAKPVVPQAKFPEKPLQPVKPLPEAPRKFGVPLPEKPQVLTKVSKPSPLNETTDSENLNERIASSDELSQFELPVKKEVPNFSDLTEKPEKSEVPEGPEVSEVPEVSETFEKPEIKKAPGLRQSPDLLDFSDLEEPSVPQKPSRIGEPLDLSDLSVLSVSEPAAKTVQRQAAKPLTDEKPEISDKPVQIEPENDIEDIEALLPPKKPVEKKQPSRLAPVEFDDSLFPPLKPDLSQPVAPPKPAFDEEPDLPPLKPGVQPVKTPLQASASAKVSLKSAPVKQVEPPQDDDDVPLPPLKQGVTQKPQPQKAPPQKAAPGSDKQPDLFAPLFSSPNASEKTQTAAQPAPKQAPKPQQSKESVDELATLDLGMLDLFQIPSNSSPPKPPAANKAAKPAAKPAKKDDLLNLEELLKFGDEPAGKADGQSSKTSKKDDGLNLDDFDLSKFKL
ncbi:MAG: hypothetical protein HQM10_23000 [Candidatus Riflebacteria bacterium]|nr:hypothetical protein [Candidatus Riflebacteria bacterium]